MLGRNQVLSGARSKLVEVKLIYPKTLKLLESISTSANSTLVLSLDELDRRFTSVPCGKYDTLNTSG